MMGELINFETNGYLFRCCPDDFNIIMRDTLTNILIHRFVPTTGWSYEHRPIKCIICWQFVIDNSRFLICEDCCETCIDENILIAIMYTNVLICYKSRYHYWCEIDAGSHINKRFKKLYENEYYNDHSSLLEYFTDCSYKLIDRFYHTTPILFLFALNDPNSDCNILNKDIVTYIFDFIY